MNRANLSRRGFLSRSLAVMAATGIPLWYGREILAADEQKKDTKVAAGDKIVLGAIGIGSPASRGRAIAQDALNTKRVQYVSICDVDARHRKSAVEWMKDKGQQVKEYKDYRELLDNKDIQAVTIAVPDHWHVLVAIEALRKGKDVYCEKPLSLTIAEGQALLKVLKGTKQVFQVGSQQRSDGRFRMACELVRNNRLGQIRTVETRIGDFVKDLKGQIGPFATAPVPEGLDWNFWQGPTPAVDFVPQRCHYTFRWWYEYSGGKMTDWGAHHNDIAQWGLGMDESGPVAVEATGFADPRSNCYNVHSGFSVHYTYAGDGPRLVCTADGENGIKFIGEDGKWIFVSRGKIDASDKKLLQEPLGSGAARLYVSNNHMADFLDSVVSRKPTICTAEIGHRSVTVCHIGVIALRTGKKLKWDPVAERFDDEEANKMLSRPMRAPGKLDV